MSVPPHLATLRSSQDRALDREGIPMYLALVSEVQPVPTPALGVADGGARADGEAIAARMDDVRGQLLASQRDGDMGALVSVLQAVSYADMHLGVASPGQTHP